MEGEGRVARGIGRFIRFPDGPCLQQALDGADDDLETLAAVRTYAKELAGRHRDR